MLPVVDKPDCIIDIFLHPGEFYFGGPETRIRTLLGSCVAITVWHPVLKIGGMCHYLLPTNRRRGANEALDGRYADDAVALFMQEFQHSRTKPDDYETKMFGGGTQFSYSSQSVSNHIPTNNIQVGRQLLQKYGFKIKVKHLGGQGHRNLIFEVWSGDVWMQHVLNP